MRIAAGSTEPTAGAAPCAEANNAPANHSSAAPSKTFPNDSDVSARASSGTTTLTRRRPVWCAPDIVEDTPENEKGACGER